MATLEKEKISLVKVDVTLANKFRVTARTLEAPAMPLKIGDKSITVGIPVLGSVSLAFIG